MDFREWQAAYGPELDDILVRSSRRPSLGRAKRLAEIMWSYLLVSQERIGYGMFKVRTVQNACNCPDMVWCGGFRC